MIFGSCDEVADRVPAGALLEDRRDALQIRVALFQRQIARHAADNIKLGIAQTNHTLPPRSLFHE